MERFAEGKWGSGGEGGELLCCWVPSVPLPSAYSPLGVDQRFKLVKHIAKCPQTLFKLNNQQKSLEKHNKFCLFRDLKTWPLQTWVQPHVVEQHPRMWPPASSAPPTVLAVEQMPSPELPSAPWAISSPFYGMGLRADWALMSSALSPPLL